jgi:shikimate dehydrogenase
MDLKEVFKDVPANTRKFGVVGWPLSHTLSPAMHTAVYKALDLDAVYRPIPVPPDEWRAFIAQAQDLPLDGFNVTVPHKETILKPGNHPTPWDADACAGVAAVNTVRRRPTGWRAFNTDVGGLQDDLRSHGVTFSNGSAVVLGAGGAARAAVAALVALPHPPKRVWVLNRTGSKAQELATVFSGGGMEIRGLDPADAAPVFKETVLIINATSVGLSPGDPSPVEPGLLHAGITVYDMIYHRETALMKAARAVGAHAVGGLGMLVHQGARAFEIWFNRRPSVDVMRRAAEEELMKRSPS